MPMAIGCGRTARVHPHRRGRRGAVEACRDARRSRPRRPCPRPPPDYTEGIHPPRVRVGRSGRTDDSGVRSRDVSIRRPVQPFGTLRVRNGVLVRRPGLARRIPLPVLDGYAPSSDALRGGSPSNDGLVSLPSDNILIVRRFVAQRAEVPVVTDIVLAGACRTPVGKYGRAFRNVEAIKLGSTVIAEAVNRAGLVPSDIEEVIMGNVISAGLGQNPARQAALSAGLPDRVGAVTINKVCGSGLQAVMFASDMIRAGSADILLAGGMESMSRAPYLVKEARWGIGINNVPFIDSMVHDGLWDAYNQFHMGVTGEIVAERFKISREEMDRFALESHRRAASATQEGRFREQIVPVDVPGAGRVEVDEGIRIDTSLEKLAKLPPVFREGGQVTAGSAPQLSDGGAAMLVLSREAADRRGVTP